MAYLWRRLTPLQRREILDHRKRLRRPWHRPPHFNQGRIFYHLTGACFEHRSHIGRSPRRMSEFSELLLDSVPEPPAAWCVLPNHYHILVCCPDLRATVRDLGKLHGRTSFRWNREDQQRGRKTWHAVSDRGIRNADHFWATLNYIHHNPVKHGYVDRWTDWPFSSARDFLEEVGRERAIELWKRYPLFDYGKGWDD